MQIRHFESARLGADLIWRGGSLLVASLRPVTVNMARIGKSSEFTRCRPRKNRLARKLARAWKSVGSWTRVEYANGWRASWKRSERAANVRRNWKARQWIARTLLLRASTRLHAPLQIRNKSAGDTTPRESRLIAPTRYTYTRNLRGWKRRVEEKKKILGFQVRESRSISYTSVLNIDVRI